MRVLRMVAGGGVGVKESSMHQDSGALISILLNFRLL